VSRLIEICSVDLQLKQVENTHTVFFTRSERANVQKCRTVCFYIYARNYKLQVSIVKIVNGFNWLKIRWNCGTLLTRWWNFRQPQG